MAALSHILVEALSCDSRSRDAALGLMQARMQSDPSGFLLALSAEFSREDLPSAARQLAGLSVKNLLKSSDPQVAGLWARLSANDREVVKRTALGALISPVKEVRQTAAQVAATAALFERALGQGNGMLDTLVVNSSHQEPLYRQSALLTLGYLLEGLPSGSLSKAESDGVLTVLHATLCSRESDLDTALAAVKALGCSLQFAAGNFACAPERTAIVDMLLAGCRANSEEVRVAALENICEAATLYYDYLCGYAGELWKVTKPFMQNCQGKEAVLALEFWSILCEVEASRIESEDPSTPVLYIAQQIISPLCPLLCSLLLTVPEDREDWSPHKAAGALLLTLAEVGQDAVVDACIDFIRSNIGVDKAANVEAALLVFGALLEGPSPRKLEPLIRQGLESVIRQTQNTHFYIRKAALWTFSRLCELHMSQVMEHPSAGALMSALVAAVQAEPEIAMMACASLVHLFKQCAGMEMFTESTFQQFFTLLQSVALQSTGDLQLAAFTALQALLEEGADRFALGLQSAYAELLSHFHASLVHTNSAQAQSLLCSTLQTVCSKLRFLDDIALRETVETVVGYFRARGCVTEEGINLTGTLASTAKLALRPFVSALWSYVVVGLAAYQDDPAVCKAAVVCVGDFARALENLATELLPTAVLALCTILAAQTAAFDAKMQAIASLGDLASSTKAGFLPYVENVLELLRPAQAVSLEVHDPEQELDLFENLQELREAVVDFYSSLIQGLGEAGKSDVLLPELPSIARFAGQVVQDIYLPTVGTHMAVLGLIGDIALTFEHRASPLLRTADLQRYVRQQEASNDAKLRSVAKWTLKQINSLGME